MFSIFKQASDTQEVGLKDLSEDQLSEVAGGKHHHHHHHHHPEHHHKHHHTTWTGAKPKSTGTGTGNGTGVVYPSGSHW